MAAPLGWVATGTVIVQVGSAIRSFYNAAVAVIAGATPANVAVAIAAGIMAVNTINTNIGVLGQIGQALLGAVQGLLADLQNLAAAYAFGG